MKLHRLLFASCLGLAVSAWAQSNVTTPGGTAGEIPMFNTSTSIQNSGVTSDGANGIVVTGAVSGSLTDKGGQAYSVMGYGAVTDAKQVLDGQMTSGSAVLYSPSAPFQSGDAGKTISVQGAGSGGSQLTTTIASFTDSSHVALAVAASATTASGVVDTLSGVTLTNAGTSGYIYGGQYVTTATGCSGTGATVSFLTVQNGTIQTAATDVPAVVQQGSGYTVGCKIYPTVPGSSADAYYTVTQVDGAGVIWGTDNYTAFSNWLSACGGGKRCLIPAGNYLVNIAQGVKSLAVPSNTTIQMDRGGLLYAVGFQNGSESANGWTLFNLASGVSNVEFASPHIRGENLVGLVSITNNPEFIHMNLYVSNVRIHGGVFEDSFGHAIMYDTSSGTGIKIDHNYFFHDNDTGTNLNSADTEIIDNTYVNDMGMECAGQDSHYDRNTIINSIGLTSIAAGGVTNANTVYQGGTVIGNKITNPLNSEVINITDGFTKGLIANNVVTNYPYISAGNTGFAIAVVGLGYNPVNGNTIANNTFTGTGHSSIFIEAPSSGTTNAVDGTVLIGNVENGAPLAGLVAYSATNITSFANVWNGSSVDVYLSQAGSNAASSGTFGDKLKHNTVTLNSGSTLDGDTDWKAGSSRNFVGIVKFGSSQQTQLDVNGVKHEGGSAPTASSGTVTGTNAGGYVSGLSSATSVTITFANSGWNTWASCVANASSGNAYPSAFSKTAVTFTFPALTGTLFYQCSGN